MSKHQGPPPDYVEVNERIIEFREKHPDGSLQAEIVELRDDLVIVKAYAYRTPDDPRPGTGLASEPIPGKTNFTRDSELMNAETSAWGRALIAVGAADAKRGIASANEVRSRQPDHASRQMELKDRINAAFRRVAEPDPVAYRELWSRLTGLVSDPSDDALWRSADVDGLALLAVDAEKAADSAADDAGEGGR